MKILFNTKTFLLKKLYFVKVYMCNKILIFRMFLLDLTKGEILHATMENLHMDFVLNKGFFVYPSAKEKFVIGATYHWQMKA
jgi:hypothetical protein